MTKLLVCVIALNRKCVSSDIKLMLKSYFSSVAFFFHIILKELLSLNLSLCCKAYDFKQNDHNNIVAWK